jgi:hypothetical protein
MALSQTDLLVEAVKAKRLPAMFNTTDAVTPAEVRFRNSSFKRLVAKATTEGAAAAFKQLLSRAVIEAAKQLLWPGSPPIAGV